MSEDSTKSAEVQANAGSKIKKGMSQGRIANKLPWWVEILFVQIGLPDTWLPKLLKAKKSTKLTFNENKKTFYYTFLLLSSMIYFYPVIKNAQLNNECIAKAKVQIDLKDINIVKILKDKDSLAYKYCNGSFQLN